MLDSSIVSDGWGYYDQLTTALQARAAQAGIPSWRNDPTLKAVYKSVVAAIGAYNPAWKLAFDTRTPDQYDSYLTDMRTIIADPGLNRDARRQDVQMLALYVQARDQITGLLKQRAAGGGSASITSSNNLDLSEALSSVVSQLEQQNTYFATYDVGRIIAKDPYLRPAADAGKAVQ
jgi:hypothetical protein